MTQGNSRQSTGFQSQSWADLSYKLDRIREAARRDRHQQMTSLMHHITPRLLLDSYNSLRKNAATGVDELTWHQCQDGLARRLLDLHDRVQSGRYRAQPSKRIYIPKDDGRERPIGIAALEDKIVQAAVVRILEQIYEEDFLGFSYGFRPGRSQHNALDAIYVGIHCRKINWILDADVKGFFDSISHEWLMKFLSHRIADRRMLRLIRKWLTAGISEDGQWSATQVGTPQGAVISPLLANIFLHYVLDLWVNDWRKKKAEGDIIIVRYADDFVLGFQYQGEAQRFLHDLRERMRKFDLELHDGKTRLIEFGRFAQSNRKKKGEGSPETFTFLGFTHVCSQTRKGNCFKIQRIPKAKCIRNMLRKIKIELMDRRHDPVPEQGRWLRTTAQGFLNYFAVPGCSYVLSVFRAQVNRIWWKALRRRSHKAKSLSWVRMKKLIKTWVPYVRIVHPYPGQRLRLT